MHKGVFGLVGIKSKTQIEEMRIKQIKGKLPSGSAT
jgi:hypothetical protein